MKVIAALQKLNRARLFLKQLEVSSFSFAAIVGLSFLTAFFEGASVSLLMPLSRGLIEGDFRFVQDIPAVKPFLAAVPAGLSEGLSNRQNVFLLVLILFGLSVLKCFFQYQSVIYVQQRTRHFSANLKKLIFKRYLSFGKLFFDRSNLGHLHRILFGFTGRIGNALTQFQNLVSQGLYLAIYLAMMLAMSWRLTLACLTVLPLLYLSTQWLIERIRRLSLEETQTQSQLSRRLNNILLVLPLVKAYSREDEEELRFGEMTDEAERLSFRVAKRQSLINPIQELLTLCILLVLVMGLTYFWGQGQRHISTFLVYFYIARRALSTFAVFNASRGQFARLEAPAEEIADVLRDQDKFFVSAGGASFPGLRRRIEFKSLSFSYVPGQTILSAVEFQIPKGSMTALVGPTGSGKTTLAHLLLRFYDVLPGQILMDGQDIRTFTLESLRGKMAFISQEPLLFHDTIRANLIYGLKREPDFPAVREVLEKSRLWGLIQRLPEGVETRIGDRGVRLSGGEKQRLSIARAMLKNADILIFDEATSSLDSTTERQIQEAISEMVKDKTSLVIAHRLSTIQKADQVVVLENGAVTEQGSLDALLSQHGRFYEYWSEQQFHVRT